MLRQFRLAALLLAALACASCGIKGPLVLPPATPAAARPTATPAAQAATSPTDASPQTAPAARKP